MKYKNEQGTCPKCGGNNLEYGTLELEGDMAYYPYTCKDCGQEGKEWYSMLFCGHDIYNGKEWAGL